MKRETVLVRLTVQELNALQRLMEAEVEQFSDLTLRRVRKVYPPAWLALVAMWVFIGVVAAYDVYLSIKYQHSLHIMEQNPLGRWLIMADDGSVAIFIGCKFFGTMLAWSIAQLLYWFRYGWAMIVSAVLAVAQALLALYLLLG